MIRHTISAAESTVIRPNLVRLKMRERKLVLPAIGEVAIYMSLIVSKVWSRNVNTEEAGCYGGAAVAVLWMGAENGVVQRILIAAVLVLAMAGGSLLPLRAGEARRSSTAAAQADELVDVNRASVAELMKIPGMTSSWAGRIVRFRPYRAKSDLLLRGVLPSDVYDRIQDHVVAHRVKK